MENTMDNTDKKTVKHIQGDNFEKVLIKGLGFDNFFIGKPQFNFFD